MGWLSWRCVVCDERFTAWAPAERHVDADHAGGRLELVWPVRPCECRPYERLRDGENPTRCYRCGGAIGSV